MPLGQFDDRQFPAANYGAQNWLPGTYNQLGYSMNGNGQNVFMDWLFPQTKEARQFAEQLEMDYYGPSAKMEGMKRAGINPLTAAGGIAGSSSAAPQPASSVNPLGDVAGAFSGAAGAIKTIEEAKQVKRLADSNISHNDAEITKWGHDNGFTDSQTEAMNIDNMTRNDLNRAELNVRRQNFLTMRDEAEKLKAEKDYIRKQLEWYDEQIQAEVNLSNKRAIEAEKHSFLMEEQKRTEQMENDFCEKFGYRRGEPFDCAMVDLWFQGEYDKVKAAQDFMYDYKYNTSLNIAEGEQTAIDNHAYSIANAQETARSLNQIITDWNQPASGLWSLIEKSFNVSGNKHGGANIGNPIEAKSNPAAHSAYCQFMVGLNLSLEDINKQIEAASAANEFSKIRELTKQRDGLMKFMNELTFEQYVQYMGSKQ